MSKRKTGKSSGKSQSVKPKRRTPSSRAGSSRFALTPINRPPQSPASTANDTRYRTTIHACLPEGHVAQPLSGRTKRSRALQPFQTRRGRSAARRSQGATPVDGRRCRDVHRWTGRYLVFHRGNEVSAQPFGHGHQLLGSRTWSHPAWGVEHVACQCQLALAYDRGRGNSFRGRAGFGKSRLSAESGLPVRSRWSVVHRRSNRLGAVR